MSARFSADSVLPGLILGSRPVGEKAEEIKSRGICRIVRCVEAGSSVPEEAMAALTATSSTKSEEGTITKLKWDVTSDKGQPIATCVVAVVPMTDTETYAIGGLLVPACQALDFFLAEEGLLETTANAAQKFASGIDRVERAPTVSGGSSLDSSAAVAKPDAPSGPDAPGRSVLVHCNAGQSRSASVVLAWLMGRAGLTLAEALRCLRASRPSVGPNRGFLRELMDLEASIFGGREDHASDKSAGGHLRPSIPDWWGVAASKRVSSGPRAVEGGSPAGGAEAGPAGGGGGRGERQEAAPGGLRLPSISLDREMGLLLARPSGKTVDECEAAYLECERDLEAALMKLLGMK